MSSEWTASWPPIQRDIKSAGFFDAAAREELLIKRCERCEQLLAPEATVCTSCGHTGVRWRSAAGSGELVSWTIVHRAPNRAYADLVPYTVGIIELAEGPWLYGRVEAPAPHAGLALRAVIVHPDDGESYPIFVPAE